MKQKGFNVSVRNQWLQNLRGQLYPSKVGKYSPQGELGLLGQGSGASMSLFHCTLWGHAEGCGLVEYLRPQGACDMASQTIDTVTVSE